MEVEEIQPQSCKFPRIGNGTGRSTGSAKMGLSDLQYPKGEEGVRPKGKIDENALIRGWHHHSRIVRVSRASGGKDRHSKVLTSKGLRDRRVRLSVPIAIQFYDIQDRLGYNQPSKAVEWLIKAAANSITELPSLNDSFLGSPTGQQQFSDEKRTSEENATEQLGLDSVDVVEMDGDPNPNSLYSEQNQNLSLSKSACSSPSETSKGSSGLSLSRTELHNNRVRARKRERTAKEKEASGSNQQPLNLILQSSFTELLEGGISMNNTVNTMTTSNGRPSGSGHQDSGNGTRQWSSAAMDYFTSGLLSGPLLRNSSRFAAGQLQMASNQIPQALPIPPFTVSRGGDGGNHHELPPPQYSFVHEGFIPLAATASSTKAEYNLNFTISSSSGSPAAGLGGFNRGTLQSNSTSQQSFLSHLQRFSTMDGPSSPHYQNIGMPFLIGTTTVPPDNHAPRQPCPPTTITTKPSFLPGSMAAYSFTTATTRKKSPKFKPRACQPDHASPFYSW